MLAKRMDLLYNEFGNRHTFMIFSFKTMHKQAFVLNTTQTVREKTRWIN